MPEHNFPSSKGDLLVEFEVEMPTKVSTPDMLSVAGRLNVWQLTDAQRKGLEEVFAMAA